LARILKQQNFKLLTKKLNPTINILTGNVHSTSEVHGFHGNTSKIDNEKMSKILVKAICWLILR